MKKLVLVSISILVLTACATSKGPSATATLSPISGSTAQGTVTFNQLKDGSVQVVVDLSGVPPGVHGFHVHDKGDCGDNGNAAGGHFNPSSAPHGGPNMVSRHAGDFGNVTADDQGVVKTTFT